MRKTDAFAETFAALRAILAPHAKRMTVTADEPGRYALASPTMTDRIGRPLFCASVQISKNYVSYHLMPVYGNKALRDSLSPLLRKRMQGKSCFNFTSVEPAQLKELAALTKKGIAGFKNLTLPWATRARPSDVPNRNSAQNSPAKSTRRQRC
jgi:hypothetical protein